VNAAPSGDARTAIVLCGGMSTRMGREKASLPFHGESLLARVVRIVAPLAGEVIVVAREGQAMPPDLPRDVRVVCDDTPGAGPLAGIAAGLAAARDGLVFVTACDAPLLEPALVELLFARAAAADAAVAVAGGFPNPLLAVYRTSVLPHARALLAANLRRPVFLFDRVRTDVVGEADVRAADPLLRSFHDCDTPEAYQEALVLGAPRVVVEFFDVARLRAGRASCDVRAANLGEAVVAAAAECPGLAVDVVRGGALSPHFRANLRGERFIDDPATPLRDGDRVLLLSAQAGG
jgi:molybdopterin-guanine dinucleotide biosynthesis protein A